MVSKFHLPCVRSYYNGSDVFILPSAITAYMTFMNADYKYFAGTSTPLEILNKNRMRGFGTWLNPKEKNNYVQYAKESTNWTKMYTISDLSFNNDISNIIFNNIPYSDNFYKPRLILEDQYWDNIPVSNNYKNHKSSEIKPLTKSDLLQYYTDNYPPFNIPESFEWTNIKNDGFIKPLNTD